MNLSNILSRVIRKGRWHQQVSNLYHNQGQNQFSSRSHAILQIAVEQRKPNNNDAMLSKFMIVDLAGSERGNMEKGNEHLY
jgi:hypothetical protein